jgi:hypothetical protein
MSVIDCEALVPFTCASCSGPTSAKTYQLIVGKRLQWVLFHECPDGDEEEFGWDETPPQLRQAILEQCGTYRLRLTQEPGSRKVAVLKVLRDTGRSLSEASAALTELLGPGIAGTDVELQLLADRLREAGVEAVAQRD